jgi:hypothetical protein
MAGTRHHHPMTTPPAPHIIGSQAFANFNFFFYEKHVYMRRKIFVFVFVFFVFIIGVYVYVFASYMFDESSTRKNKFFELYFEIFE